MRIELIQVIVRYEKLHACYVPFNIKFIFPSYYYFLPYSRLLPGWQKWVFFYLFTLIIIQHENTSIRYYCNIDPLSLSFNSSQTVNNYVMSMLLFKLYYFFFLLLRARVEKTAADSFREIYVNFFQVMVCSCCKKNIIYTVNNEV